MCAQAATEAAERRACRAIMQLSCAAAGPSGHWVTIRTLHNLVGLSTFPASRRDCSKVCQRRAVCQLPLLASASAGLTITTCFFMAFISMHPFSEQVAQRWAGAHAAARCRGGVTCRLWPPGATPTRVTGITGQSAANQALAHTTAKRPCVGVGASVHTTGSAKPASCSSWENPATVHL